jgi:hypothetical protein
VGHGGIESLYSQLSLGQPRAGSGAFSSVCGLDRSYRMVLDDNQKIGVGLICLGLGFVSLGVIMFLDAS